VSEGAVDVPALRAAVEKRFPKFESECLATSKRRPTLRAGSVTIRFRVSGGRATNRSVEAASPPANGGVDTCLERAFADVELPGVTEPTTVLYTLSFTPSAR
jgi:hypothetical protein